MNPILRRAIDADFAFAFEAKKDAMGEHISARWGWDEWYQLNLHQERWGEKLWYFVMAGRYSSYLQWLHRV
jgi:hypothetical protein